MPSPNIDQLMSEFDAHEKTYRGFTSKVEVLVRDLLDANGIVVHAVDPRTKTRASFLKKAKRTDRFYSQLEQLTDVSGVRIITYFEEDVARVAKILKPEFVIDEGNSGDKRATSDADRFGYASLHYIASLSESRSCLPEYKAYSGLKIEIQIRSLLQHTWAEIEHDLGYKTALSVPRLVRRRLARLSGLLELADDEFNTIRTQLREYEARLEAQIVDVPHSVLLDRSSVVVFIRTSPLVADVDQNIAQSMNLKLAGNIVEDPEKMIDLLSSMDVENIGQLRDLLVQNSTLIPEFVVATSGMVPYTAVEHGDSIGILSVLIAFSKPDKFGPWLAKYASLDAKPPATEIQAAYERLRSKAKL